MNSDYAVRPEYAAPKTNVITDVDKATEQFIAAYDEWALSHDGIGGPLFDAMLYARDMLLAAAPRGCEEEWRIA